jgi:hypothetical protein
MIDLSTGEFLGHIANQVELYRAFERFVQLVRKHNPHCLLHFEDFGTLLDYYPNIYPKPIKGLQMLSASSRNTKINTQFSMTTCK